MPFARSDSPYPLLKTLHLMDAEKENCTVNALCPFRTPHTPDFYNTTKRRKPKCLRDVHVAKSGEAQQSAAQSARRVELEGLSGESEVLPVPRFINAEGARLS